MSFIEREVEVIDRELHLLIRWYKSWRYHNTFLLLVSLSIFLILLRGGVVDQFVIEIGRLGYLGALIAGLLFVSTFTIAPAGLMLFFFAQNLDPILVALFASAGAIIGDHIIFHIVKDGLIEELRPIFLRLGGSHITRIFSTPHFAWLAPVIGAIFIIAPFPNEIGVGLMGISRMKYWEFTVISAILNTIGVFAIVLVAASF